jgi:hypothetical protein
VRLTADVDALDTANKVSFSNSFSLIFQIGMI